MMEHAAIPLGGSGSEPRRLSAPLIIGIILLPLVFGWFVLREGYGSRARAVTVTWAVLCLFIGIVGQPPRHESGSGSVANRSDRASLAPPFVKPRPAAAAASPSPSRREEKPYIEVLDDTMGDLRKVGFVRREDTAQTTWAVAVGTIGSAAALYADASNYNLTEKGQARRARFLDELGVLQARAFPRIRQLQAKALNEKLWKHDITVEARSAGGSSLLFTGIIFAANRNIQEVMETVVEDALAARFKRLEFRAYKGDDITYYDIKPLPDSKVATFAYNRWTPVV